MGHAEVIALHDVIARYWWQRGYDVLNPIGWDSFGLPAENAAIKRDEHPATYTYANIETQAESFRRYGDLLRLVAPAAHLRPGVLPLDAVAVPAASASAGWPTASTRPVNWCPNDQTVLANEQVVDGHVRALRRRGHQARADAVVLQDHRVRPAAAGRHGRAGATWPDRVLADAAQLDRPLRGRARGLRRSRAATSRSPSSRPARTRCSARPSWWSRRTPSWPTSCAAPEQREAFEAYRDEVRKASDIDRLSTDRPKTGVFLGGTRPTR